MALVPTPNGTSSGQAGEGAAAAGLDADLCPVPKGSRKRWLKRVGAAGFLFFLIKGLLWLALPLAYALLR